MMYHDTFAEAGKEFARLERRNARRAYNNGYSVFAYMVNDNPLSAWSIPAEMNLHSGLTFEEQENDYLYYNRSNERGHYVKYYIEKK